MAVLFMDSFDHYDTNALLRKWTSRTDTTVVPSTAQKRTGPQSLYLPKKQIVKTIVGIDKTFCIGLAIYRAAGGYNAGYPIVALRASNNAILIALHTVSTNDLVQAFRVLRGATEIVASPAVWFGAAWGYVELRGFLDDAAGWVEVYFDGVRIAHLENADTQEAALVAHNIALGAANSNATALYVDDMYISDGDLLGPINIHACLPSGAGAASDLTPSAAVDNYTCVDDTTPDDDATYVSSDVVDARDLYSLGNTPTGAGAIKHVQVVLSAAKDDAGARAVHVVTRKGATEHVSAIAHRPVNGTYDPMLIEQVPLNPLTGTAWEVADMDTQFGVQIED
jgi:hypothetical protein